MESSASLSIQPRRALSLARRLGVMESVESDEHREKDDKEVDKNSLQTSKCR